MLCCDENDTYILPKLLMENTLLDQIDWKQTQSLQNNDFTNRLY
jgi:hypothetical protein